MRILVLCTGNSCRSQMAEGFLRKLLSKEDEVFSAGLEPQGVNPRAVQVMSEIGIDISSHTSNNIQEFITDTFDYVITVCDNAAANCPIFPGEGKKIHLPFEDPAHASGTDEEILNEFRKIRDLIDKTVSAWILSLNPQ